MQDKSLLYRLLWLFKANVIISCLAVGGGYVVIPLIKKQFIDDKKAIDIANKLCDIEEIEIQQMKF